MIYLYLSGTFALPHSLPANKPSRFTPTRAHIHVSPPPPPQRNMFTHTETRGQHISQPTRLHNLKGDIRNKFDTSAYPRSALRTKRNLILDKPPDRISALALCCWFTAIPSTLTSHTLARFPRISPPPRCLFFCSNFFPSFASPRLSHHLFSPVFPLFCPLSLLVLLSSPHLAATL